MSKAKMKKRTATKKFRAWIAQVNQTYVDVVAVSEEEADAAARRKWRREYGHAELICMKEL